MPPAPLGWYCPLLLIIEDPFSCIYYGSIPVVPPVALINQVQHHHRHVLCLTGCKVERKPGLGNLMLQLRQEFYSVILPNLYDYKKKFNIFGSTFV